ncbi:THAP domain-containing protein 8-like [Ambystoma mexicanum]|uniref:THAP domain-containing protein 8-like n=1 Tax=Ambystoma mexicanum TaxID=8296 RepID=UPI0037E77159
MTRYCVAQKCVKYQRVKDSQGRPVTFHKFPKDPELRQRWVLALQRNNGKGDHWQPTAYSSLCSLHFTEECMDRTGQTVRVWKGAVPTVFEHVKKREPKPMKPSVPAVAQESHNALMIAERSIIDGTLLTRWKEAPSEVQDVTPLERSQVNSSDESDRASVQQQIDLTGDDLTVRNNYPRKTSTQREGHATPLQVLSYICNVCGKNISGYTYFKRHRETCESAGLGYRKSCVHPL